MKRLIMYVNKRGNPAKEGVYFTEDYDSPASDFIPLDCEVHSDTVIDADLPSDFPLDTALEKT